MWMNELHIHTVTWKNLTQKKTDEIKKPDTEEYIPYDSMYLKHNMVKMNLMPLETGIAATFQRRGYEEAPPGAASTFYIFICVAVI